MLRSIASVLLAIPLLIAARQARANDFESEPAMAPPRPPPASSTNRTWYGWQTLLTSGVGAVGLVGTLAFQWPQQLRTPALGLYLAGGPIVHAANGHPDRILRSLALEVGAPLAGTGAWLLGMMAESPCDSGLPHPSDEQRMAGSCRLGPALLLASIVAGPAIDAFGFAWTEKASGQEPTAQVAPYLAPVAAGGVAGVHGRF